MERPDPAPACVVGRNGNGTGARGGAPLQMAGTAGKAKDGTEESEERAANQEDAAQ